MPTIRHAKSSRNAVKPINKVIAREGEKDTTTYTLHRNTEGRIWVSTWEAGDKGYGGDGGSYYPNEFDRVVVKGRTLGSLVEEAIQESDRDDE